MKKYVFDFYFNFCSPLTMCTVTCSLAYMISVQLFELLAFQNLWFIIFYSFNGTDIALMLWPFSIIMMSAQDVHSNWGQSGMRKIVTFCQNSRCLHYIGLLTLHWTDIGLILKSRLQPLKHCQYDTNIELSGVRQIWLSIDYNCT